MRRATGDAAEGEMLELVAEGVVEGFFPRGAIDLWVGGPGSDPLTAIPDGPDRARDADSSPAWVLVVDDDRDCRDSLALLLRASGCAVKTAQNGREALDLLRNTGVPAVILLDNLMPTMTGEEFLEERKGDPRLSDIPVLLLSAWGLSATGKRLEVDEYVHKPYDPERVISLVRNFLKR
jgi:CheY-like chemotaxis protein